MYCDVSLPVPLDQPFTYSLPAAIVGRVRPGCRVLVPFGPRSMTGMVLAVHENPPVQAARDILRLVDDMPVLDAALLDLGRWIAAYYCAPLGEVLRTMAPMTGEIRRGKVFSLTDAGRDVVRQLWIGEEREDDPDYVLLRSLEARPLNLATLKAKVADAARRLAALAKRGLIRGEDDYVERDPLRASAARLIVEFLSRGEDKLPKAQRELLAFLELHPGRHRLSELESTVKHASPAARALARRGCVALKLDDNPASYVDRRPPPPLNEDQHRAYEAICAAAASKQFQPFLLQGVTGSGKTEVYLRCIEAVLAEGRGALLLVPEIALTPQVAGQFLGRFGDRVAILHSAFSDSERAAQFRKIRAGEARVVVGTRSGVFAPVKDLGLVIVDEEHDGSYKQEETPRYNGRDVAVVRARAAGAVIVLGSATPALETRYNVERGKYRLLELPGRIEARPMPEVEIVDQRTEFLETGQQRTFSRRLVEMVRQRLDAREQVMLLMNRRGFSSFVACRSCGHRIECVNCAVTLTFHRRDRRLLCHYCNYAERVPQLCPQCQSEHIYFLGTGSEKVEDELGELFPAARIARMDRDTVVTKRHYETILSGFREGAYDILVGTQMIAKGHDIPNVTMVGIVNADIGLGMPDFRAAERTFQLLTQAAGRAGRGAVAGTVVIQTINPDHYAVRFASQQNYRLFYEKEIQFRRAMRYPPFAALANVVVRAAEQERAFAMASELAALVNPPPEYTRVLGPSEAPVRKLKAEFRYQMLIKSQQRRLLGELLNRLRRHAYEQKWPATALVIDVDPTSLL
ncbi:MAG: primosomal protein N' [Bryobacter sp.]|nr:primosomal protein N' [Bryobacter sp.]